MSELKATTAADSTGDRALSDPRQRQAGQLLSLGLRHQQSGELGRAELVYCQALELHPGNAELLRLLGLLAYQQGKGDEAIGRLTQAIGAAGSHAGYHYELGVILHEQGRMEEAIEAYKAAASLVPERADVAEALASAMLQSGAGCVHELLGLLEQHPSSNVLHQAYATALQADGQDDAAQEQYERLVCKIPQSAQARHALGALLLQRGTVAGALEHLRVAVDIDPESAAARNDLGLAFWKSCDLDAAQKEFGEALRIEPGMVDACNNLGGLYRARGDLKLAVAYYQLAVHHHPEDGVALENLGQLNGSLGRIDLAIDYYEHAARRGREPLVRSKIDGLRLRKLMNLPPIFQTGEEIEVYRRQLKERLWDLADEKHIRLRDPLHEVGITNFFLAYHGHGDADIQRKIGEIYRRAWPLEQPKLKRGRDRRLRIGFVSANLYNHTIGKLNRGLIANLNPTKFSAHVFLIGERNDRTTHALRQSAESFTSLPRDLGAVRQSIVDAGLDVLLFTDIGMEPYSYFLAFSRLAPVQCVTWGHPITTGIDTVDYFLSGADLEVEGNERHYTERLIRLPTMQPYYYHPQIVGNRKTRAALGLPEDRTVYLCPQSLFKLHPSFDSMIGGILRSDGRGLVALIHGHDASWSQLLLARFRSSIPDVLDRVRILPRTSGEDFMNLIAVSDVMLDTPLFCGGNTTYEGLAMGCPIVTLPSELLRGRLSYGIYKKLGLLDCVARSPEEYVNIALRLGTDPDHRAHVSESIRSRVDVLYEDAQTVRELEEFFLSVAPG